MKRLLHLVNEVGLGTLFAAMVSTVLLFGAGYWVAGQQGLIDFMWETKEHVSFGDAIYFSIETISSLGYGDIRPLGWARILVGLEVFTGLAFFGLIVAKVSSVKQDYILRRMYGETVDRKITQLLEQLEEQRALYRTTSALLLNGEIDPELTTTFRRDTPGTTFFGQYRQLIAEVEQLIAYEASNHALFGVVDGVRLESVYNSIRGVLRRTTLLWERDQALAIDYVLRDHGDDLEAILHSADRVSDIALRDSSDPEVCEIAEAIKSMASEIRTRVLPAL